MTKRLISLTIILMLCLFLTGCWDSTDIQKRNIVLAIALDRKENEYSAILEIAKIRSIKNKEDESSSMKNVSLLKKTANNMQQLTSKVLRSEDMPIFVGASRVLVISQEMAKNGVEDIVNFMTWLPEYRKTADIVITGDDITKLLSDVPENDISAGFAIEDTLYNLVDNGRALHVSLGDIDLSTVSGKNSGHYIPYIGIREDETTLIGYAILKDYKLIGIVPYDEARGLQYLVGKKANLRFDIPIPGDSENKAVFLFDRIKRRITTDYINGKLAINVQLELELKFRYLYRNRPITDELKKGLEKEASEIIKNHIGNIIKRAQQEYKCDFFNFLLYFRAQHPQDYSNILGEWNEKFSKADIKIDVKAKTGLGVLIDTNAKNPYRKE